MLRPGVLLGFTHLRSSKASAAVLKSIGTIDLTISLILRTLASEMPLTSHNLRVVAWASCFGFSVVLWCVVVY